MIKLAEELNNGMSRFAPQFYKFLCDGCDTVLYIIPILFDKSLIETMKTKINLCEDCYQKKTEEELSQIARLSSEIVIKEMAKMKMHTQILEDENIKKEDFNLTDLKKYLEFKLIFQ